MNIVTKLAAAVVVSSFATASAAQEISIPKISFIGETGYSVDAEVLDMEAGAELDLSIVNLTIVGQAAYDNSVADPEFTFTGVELTSTVGIVDGIEGFSEITFDDEFGYQDTRIGVAFKF